MTLPLWGSLQKSTNDAETIEQAIARLIAVHEEAPTSHLGVGESLAAHKAESIIDHPQGSVLADKYTNREFTLTPDFCSFDAGYTYSGAGISRSLGGLRLETGGVVNTIRQVGASGQYSPVYFTATRETTFQYTAQMLDTADYIAYGVAGADGITELPPGIGFKFVNNAVYAVEIYEDDVNGTTEIATLIVGASASVKSLYRVHLDTDGTLTYYINGDLVHTASVHISYDFGLRLFTFSLENTASVNKRAQFSGVYFASAIN